jgi:RNA polymerase sigma-70 factor (ECF subfamily)
MLLSNGVDIRLNGLLAMLYARARQFVRNESEDRVHETIMRVREHLNRHPDDELDDPEGFLVRVLQCVVNDYYRKAYRRQARARHVPLGDLPLADERAVEPSAPMEKLEESIANLRRMTAALSHLPEQDAEIIRRKYALGEDYRQIAEILGMNESTVRSRAHRAMKRLRAPKAGSSRARHALRSRPTP